MILTLHLSKYTDGTSAWIETDGGCSIFETDGRVELRDCNTTDVATFSTVTECILEIQKRWPEVKEIRFLT